MAGNARTTPAIVISTIPVGESDLLATLFTQKNGKLRAIAKGAKRSKKRFMNALEPFTEVMVHVVRKNPAALWRLESAGINKGFEAIRTDYRRFVFASLCLELTDLWHREEVPEQKVYLLLKWSLEHLDAGASPAWVCLVFQTRLLKACGYLPGLARCKLCNGPVRGSVISFDKTSGEPFCQGCTNNTGGLNICAGTARSLDFIGRTDLYQVGRLKVTDALIREGWMYLKALHCYHLQKEPSSYKFIDSLKEIPRKQREKKGCITRKR